MKIDRNICIVAEIGSVHDGSFGNACNLIEAAARAGADMVKFQTHLPESETLPDAPTPSYFKNEPRMEYFKRTGFSLSQWKDLARQAKDCDVEFVSSPFSIEAVELLEEVGVSTYKIASGEVTNLPLLERITKTKKPVFLSSGMSSWSELDTAVDTLKKGGPLTVMQCSSTYPCPPEEVGLNVILEMQERYKVPIGFSDHTLGFAAAIGAATLGATVIEKHFTFSRLMYGSDAKHSMEPDEFNILVSAIHEVELMQKKPVDKSDISKYRTMKLIFEKSIVTTCPVSKGTVLKNEHLAYKKPGDGISAAQYQNILGKRTSRDLPKDYKIKKEDLL